MPENSNHHDDSIKENRKERLSSTSSSLLSSLMSDVTIHDIEEHQVVNREMITTKVVVVEDGKQNEQKISHFEDTISSSSKPKPKKRIIIRRKQQQPVAQSNTSLAQSKQSQQQTSSSMNIKLYEELIKTLPAAYDFELLKTIHRCYELHTRHIALQMPEGLLMYACMISDILIQLVVSLQSVTILSDVTYGACCIDDINASLLHCDLLIHYGHSCLIPMQHTTIPILYVFVEIQINIQHVIDCFLLSIREYKEEEEKGTIISNDKMYIYLLGTVQFRHALITIQHQLQRFHNYPHVMIPQSKPLSPGEVLGCTSPQLIVPASSDPFTVCLFVADGRFHMESTMITNPHINLYYRYNPYTRIITTEQYDHTRMNQIRGDSIQKALHAIHYTKPCCTVGIIMGTLGRQGNPAIAQRIKDVIHQYNHQRQDHSQNNNNAIRHFVMLLSEISPTKLNLFSKKVHIWIQIACPRLSIDWGHYLTNQNTVPVLNPYEFFCCFNPDLLWYKRENSNNSEIETKQMLHSAYPMDYYSYQGGPWSNYHETNKSRSMIRTDDASKICCNNNGNASNEYESKCVSSQCCSNKSSSQVQ